MLRYLHAIRSVRARPPAGRPHCRIGRQWSRVGSRWRGQMCFWSVWPWQMYSWNRVMVMCADGTGRWRSRVGYRATSSRHSILVIWRCAIPLWYSMYPSTIDRCIGDAPGIVVVWPVKWRPGSGRPNAVHMSVGDIPRWWPIAVLCAAWYIASMPCNSFPATQCCCSQRCLRRIPFSNVRWLFSNYCNK